MKSKQPQKNKKAICRPTQNNWHQMNRKQRREMTRKIQSEDVRLELVHPDAASIDIGNESHYVAVPPTRGSQPVRCFGCTTSELKGMAVWLKQRAIPIIALQSTGVHWIAVYDILEEAGFEVYLVNAKVARRKIYARMAVSLRGKLPTQLLPRRSHAGLRSCFLRQAARCCRQPFGFCFRPGGQVYIVVSERSAVRLPEVVLDRIGVPGVVVKGKAFEAGGLRTLAVEGFAP
jgi:hypothetical protein